MAKKLGLGVRHDLAIPAVAEGLMPDAEWKKIHRQESWTAGDSFNYGIGQGFTLASPLHLAIYAARIASGRALKPRLVHTIGGEPVPIEPAPPLEISEASLRIVRDGMYAVSNEGTAYRSRLVDPANIMAGKTGTSQVRIITAAERAAGVTRNEQLPWNRRDHALFVAFAPYENPRYAISLIVEHGGGGSAAAAPIARDILARALYGGTPPLEAYPAEQRPEIEERFRALETPLAATEPAEPEDRA
jgi:penicillin-binding protein 2